MDSVKTIAFFGDGGVGKTAYIKKLLTGKFEKRYIPTLGMNIYRYNYFNQTIDIIDFSGQEKFNINTNINYDNALIFYDSTSRITFKNIKFWESKIPENVPITYVRTKCELKNKCPDIGIPISIRNENANLFSPIESILTNNHIRSFI